MRPLLLLLLISNAVASTLPVRADWMRAAGVGQVQFYGQFGDGHLIGGVDGRGRLRVARFLESVGWGVMDLGDITMSRSIEPLALIWITYAANSGWTKRDHAFKLLNR